MHFMFVHRLISKPVIGLLRTSNSKILKYIVTSNAARSLCNTPFKDNASQVSTESSKNLTWTPIYYFPYVNLVRLLSRLKLYQSVITVAAFPISIGLYNYDTMDITSVTVVTGAAMFTCITLYAVTSLFKRLIGSIFVDESKTYVKIAHLTFWGNRKDIVIPVEDIIPLTDGYCKATDVYIKVRRYSSDEFFYLNLRFGKYFDKIIFQDIFGDFEILHLEK